MASCKLIRLSGQVQGVGFRPFIFNLAQQHQLKGWVRNAVGIVEIHTEGTAESIDRFINEILSKKPPLAQPKIESISSTVSEHRNDFTILKSESEGAAQISLPVDLHLCDDCLAELNDPQDRRFRYPFINCTQCGPRYTLIEKLPYDRPNTSMADFALCPVCQQEYDDPASRRFHAEPIACPVCGPSLSFHTAGETTQGNEESLKRAVDAIKQGKVLALKGVGGYHLVCDASNPDAVALLRQRKARPHKPFAVMMRAEEVTKGIEQAALEFLKQASRPILLVPKSELPQLADAIAPGLGETGIMLPYSPLHHLLLNDCCTPLVATSANISGEPVLTDETEVEQRLARIADLFLHHNRPIVRPADDPVYRPVAGAPRPIRLGRGSAPLELSLPFKLEQPVIAVGAQMKNTITLAWEDRAVVSPHIGEMHTPRSLQIFENTIQDLQALYQVKAGAIIHDAHPAYTASRWAQLQGLPLHSVLHHHAHAAAAYYECNTDESVIAFSWDGTGYGDDGILWGGETFIGTPGNWQRVATLKPFKLPGGDKASREPWRCAAALCWGSGMDYEEAERDPLLKQAWERGINAPQSSSVGRLFDAAAALSGICLSSSFEGQAAMLLESHASPTQEHVALELKTENGLLQLEWQPLIGLLRDHALSTEERASRFHSSLAQAILQQALLLRQQHDISTVTFSGGVFQNRLLSEQAMRLLTENDFTVHFPQQLPVNDAAISFGQIIEFGLGTHGR